MSTGDAKLAMFEPLTIRKVTFKNRIVRSAMGNRQAFFDGTVTNAWGNFEHRFARNGVGGIISTTLAVNGDRTGPLQYPQLSNDRHIGPLAAAIAKIKADTKCVYIIQIGDPGYQCQTSLFPQKADGRTSSPVIDGLYGYVSAGTAMTPSEIGHSVEEHVKAVRRAKRAGADGVEITAAKGYLIHQFLNPGINRRDDDYGGSPEKRFRFLREVVTGALAEADDNFLICVRMSAIDHNHLPVNIRFPLSSYFRGNTLKETLVYAQELERLGVDLFHVTQGFGFPNAKESPGAYPLEQIRMFANSTRHLSFKALLRSIALNSFPVFLLRLILGIGWRLPKGEIVDIAAEFKKVLERMPVIANGGFQARDLIEDTLAQKKADLVSMARPLLANPNLLAMFREGKNLPDKPCTHCNACAILTALQPLGCYDRTRFKDDDAMEREILHWSGNPEA